MPIYTVEDVEISGGGVLIREDITQFIPGSALSGTYYYNAYVRNHLTWELFWYETFPFMKSPGDGAQNHDYGWALFGWEDSKEPLLSSLTTSEFILHPSSPNPFNLETKLTFILAEAGEISLVVYDVQGREAARLVGGWRPAGTYESYFSGAKLPSGVYFARLTTGDFRQTQRLLLVK